MVGKHKDLDALEAKIRQAEEHRHKPEEEKSTSMPASVHAGLEFVGAILVGVAAGLGLDHWLGTKPMFFLGLFFLGIATGFYNVYKITQGSGTGVGFSRLHPGQKNAKKAPD